MTNSALHDPQTKSKTLNKPVEIKQQAVLSTRPLGDVSSTEEGVFVCLPRRWATLLVE